MRWQCSKCGHPNTVPDGQRRVCNNCGHDEDMYELPEEEETRATKGYY